MTPSVSVAVMAHPKRAEMVEDLLDRLDAPATVVWDEIQDRHDTGVRALEAFDPDCTHHMVIQDDALPCRDLVAGVTKALEVVPDGHPLSMYVGRLRPRRTQVAQQVIEATEMGASFLRMQAIYWGPCVVVPTRVLPDLCPWFRRANGIQNYDRRMSKWFEARDRECWYSWPCLVDHRGEESLSHPHAGARGAHNFIGETSSALDVDWSGPVYAAKGMEKWDQRRQEKARRSAARMERAEARMTRMRG